MITNRAQCKNTQFILGLAFMATGDIVIICQLDVTVTYYRPFARREA